MSRRFADADKCIFEVLTQDVLSESESFTCGEDPDMDEFFQKGRLAVSKDYAGQGVGSEIIDFIKLWLHDSCIATCSLNKTN